MLDAKAGTITGLSMIVELRGPLQIHPMVVLTLHEEIGVREAGVHDMRSG
jgi:hypothetical protein